VTQPPRVLIIAGSDSSGGAGVQADIKTVTMLGGYAMTAITAITAQNTTGVFAVEVLSPALVAAQIDACLTDIGVDAVKIGMLGSPAIANAVADRLTGLAVPIAFDPVMIATSGAALADVETIAAFERLLAIATVVTPNTEELSVLADRAVKDEWDMGTAAEAVMLRTGCTAVLAKGGHIVLEGEFCDHAPDGSTTTYAKPTRVFDFLYQQDAAGWREQRWHSDRLATRHTHGTGCTLSSAVATLLGMGLPLETAVERGRDFVHAALLAAPGFGSGHGPLGHAAVRQSS
jgi:hydroxymethylpyrimidine/phosphomethylpyrimidine kinase